MAFPSNISGTRWLIIIIVILIIAATGSYFLYSPQGSRLGTDDRGLDSTREVESVPLRIWERSRYELGGDWEDGPAQSARFLIRQGVADSGSVEAVFQVLDPLDETKVKSESVQKFEINPQTREIVSGKLQASKPEYFISPLPLSKRDFSGWILGYDAPFQFKFEEVVNFRGNSAYQFKAVREIDETMTYSYLLLVPEEYDVVTSISATLWLDLENGKIVGYEDQATSFYFDRKNNKNAQSVSEWGNEMIYEN